MAVASSSSKFLSFISPTDNNKPISPTLKTHLKFPTISPSISLKSQNNPHNRNGLFVTKMGTYTVQIVVEENEPEDRLLNRFRREVLRAGVIQECKRRRFFENSQDKRKRKTREAAKKNRKWRPKPKVVKPDNTDPPKKELYNSDEDDWDFQGGDIPNQCD